MKDARGFIVFWLLNSLVFYFAPFILVGLVVTGNVRLTSFMASIISGFLLTLADAFTQPALTHLNIKLKDEWQWTLIYLFINVIGIWVIARYADLTGVGIANAWMVVLLGIIVSCTQWASWKFVADGKKFT